METPKCDGGCGDDATCQFEEVGLCDDCAADALRQQMRELTGKVCASVSRQPNGYLQVCLAPYGVEHAH